MANNQAIQKVKLYSVLVPQTFGGMANWNPHVHSLITNACWDREGNQYVMAEIGTASI